MRVEIELYQRPTNTGLWAIIILKNDETKTAQILRRDGEWDDASTTFVLTDDHYHRVPR